MLALAITLPFLLVILYIFGEFLCRIMRIPNAIRTGDHFVLSLWLGLATLACGATIYGLLAPLSPFYLVFLVLLCFIAIQTTGGIRTWLKLCWVYRWAWVAVLLLLVGTAFIGSQIITNRDGLSYQFDIITWLSTTGIVPGLGLVHSRYGFLSTWFNLPAVFNHGPLFARMAALSNILLLFLTLSHWSLCLYRGLRGRMEGTDRFVLFAMPMAVFLPIFLNIPISPTPDFPVTVLTIVTAWSMMLLASQKISGLGADNFRLPFIPVLLGTLMICAELQHVKHAVYDRISKETWQWQDRSKGISVCCKSQIPQAVQKP